MWYRKNKIIWGSGWCYLSPESNDVCFLLDVAWETVIALNNLNSNNTWGDSELTFSFWYSISKWTFLKRLPRWVCQNHSLLVALKFIFSPCSSMSLLKPMVSSSILVSALDSLETFEAALHAGLNSLVIFLPPDVFKIYCIICPGF